MNKAMTVQTAGGQQAIIQAVLDGVTSQHTKRAYERALCDFMAWHGDQGRPALTKATVQRYAADLQAAGMGAASINQRLSAIRKLAQEAADNGALPEPIANGISRVKGIRQEGRKSGNWLTKEQAQAMLNLPDPSTLKGLRDRAMLACLIGCGLRRDELARLDWRHIQQRDGRWALVDITGKRNKTRTVPMPPWAYEAVRQWGLALAGTDGYLDLPTSGFVFKPMNKGDRVSGDRMSTQAVWRAVELYATKLGLVVRPHDLRRTFAKLAHKGGAALDQIQLSLGHASIQTTEKYLGVEQSLTDAPCDHIGLKLD